MSERIALLVAYLDADLEAADRLALRLAEERGLPPDVDASWKGHTLHNLYGALERLFEHVARAFENQVEDLSRYHAELLRRMILDIPGVRPALLSRGSYELLNELRGFRHVFRHAYDQELDNERVERLARRVSSGWPEVLGEIRQFRNVLRSELGEGEPGDGGPGS